MRIDVRPPRGSAWLAMFLWLAVAHAACGAEAQDPRGDQGRRGGLSSFGAVFKENCAVCHGDNLEGAPQGTPLVGVDLIHGDSMDDLSRAIADGFPEKGMPAWSTALTTEEIKSLALWISEYRGGMLYSEFNTERELHIPTDTLESEAHAFRLEVLTNEIDPLPYSIAPLPDGRLLVTEKMKGLRIISADGELSDLVDGTPTVYDDARVRGPLKYGMGWLLDVAPHPDYAENGWIYLHYTDRCNECNAASIEAKRPVSMNTLIRGRIRDGKWVDQESIWKADIESYSPFTDVAAGGRIAFDPDGYVFISVGMKSIDRIQDLTSPHGKTHRVHDDGRIPADNPFIDDPDAGNTIWTYGHRSPQGLEFNAHTRQLWGTEHGPRGGDEINLLLPGRNYGWPLYSKGQNYNGSKVDWGKELGIEFELKDIEQPVVDLTPSPAVSSFVFYEGNAFPEWQGNIIVGSLKASHLYRVVIEDNKFVHKERLIENLARIRDIEVGPTGEIFLLLEHASGGQIVKMVPSGNPVEVARAN